MNSIESAYKSSKSGAVFTTLIGALLLGMLWRMRGETGWGSSWGLLMVGFIFTLFLVLVTGERKKLSFGWFGLTAVSFMLTVPSWGTLLYQITGMLYFKEFWVRGDEYTYISPASGVFLMLCLGFGMAAIYGVMLGRAYSDKSWKIKDIVILLAVFYAVGLISKASVSHWILNLIQPQASEIFSQTLKEAGITDDVYHVYLQHFDDLSWAKQFDGGRNYFSSIQAISSTIRAAALLIADRFIVKDRISAKIGFVVCCAFALSITLADIFFFVDYGGYRMSSGLDLPDFISSWTTWEYFTGFIAGGIITAYIIRLKPSQDVSETAFSKVPSRLQKVLTFLLCDIFIIGLNVVRPLYERFRDYDFQIIIAAAAGVITLAVCIVIVKKCGVLMEKSGMMRFGFVAVPTFVIYNWLVYMFLGDADHFNIKEINSLHNILITVSAAAVLIWCVVKNRKNKF